LAGIFEVDQQCIGILNNNENNIYEAN
jgi:hypothetical protein